MAEATRVIATDGPSAVSLRALTRALGVSHAAPKNHFPSKEALFAEIAREGFINFADRLTAAGNRARNQGDGPVEVLEAQGLAYLEFAAEHSSHFALMFRGDLYDQAVIAGEAAAAFSILRKSVEDAQRRGWNQSAETQHLTSLVWSTVHGHAHLEGQSMPVDSSIEGRGAVIRLLLRTGADTQAKRTTNR